ncbi:hypothetical protein [Actinacidiphila sp. bgisy167]|uniref:hypothetical protein n=1 Tax=Actinacidiphila sp. bgisy167 TaxID=3413797 RepID=UPI003D71369B
MGDTAAVVLWRQRVAHGRRLLWIGPARRQGAPPLRGAARGPMARATAGALVPVPYDLLLASRRVNGRRRLAAALE